MDRSRWLKKLVIWKDKNLTKKHILKFGFLFIVVAVVLPFLLVFLIRPTYQSKIVTSISDMTHYKVAIVFGATVSDNVPSSALQDRITAAVNLYKAGKVEKIIMSGNGVTGEPAVMVQSAINQGIPAESLISDPDSLRTYDTCYRARNVFDLGRAVLISQPVHLLRALYICNSIGLNSIGFAASATASEDITRETLSFLRALWDINLVRPNNVSTADSIAI